MTLTPELDEHVAARAELDIAQARVNLARAEYGAAKTALEAARLRLALAREAHEAVLRTELTGGV